MPATLNPAALHQPSVRPAVEVEETKETPKNRFSRQASFVPRERVLEESVTIIGVGAIGRQVALQLASLGVPKLQIFDFDNIEMTNVTTQGYLFEDIGKSKVEACSDTMKRIDPELKIQAVNAKYSPDSLRGSTIFCCVDSIDTRKDIFDSERGRCKMWIDARMLGETIRIITSKGVDGADYYESTLFPGAEAERGTCTGQGTIYTASIAAGLMLQQYTKYLREYAVEKDILFNLLASDLVVIQGA